MGFKEPWHQNPASGKTTPFGKLTTSGVLMSGFFEGLPLCAIFTHMCNQIDARFLIGYQTLSSEWLNAPFLSIILLVLFHYRKRCFTPKVKIKSNRLPFMTSTPNWLIFTIFMKPQVKIQNGNSFMQPNKDKW